MLQRVANGEEIIITVDSKPVAKLIPYVEKPHRRVPGTAKGQIWISPDFDEPLPTDMLDAFNGKQSL